MGLLLAPLQLSADWSFACIPPVEALADPRNLAMAVLYAWLLWVLLSARPWQARSLVLRRWQLWVMMVEDCKQSHGSMQVGLSGVITKALKTVRFDVVFCVLQQ